MPWKQWLGATPQGSATHFRVWAPKAQALEVRIQGGPAQALQRDADGYFTGLVQGVRAGARYLYRFPDGRERPDPASLLQPEGVHGPSEVVDLAALTPRTRQPFTPLEKLVFSEIHLGTFTPQGTAQAAAERMPALADALFTAVEVMPVAAFPGARNWGYDGVFLFAAHAAYGGPAGLSRLVEAAHQAGLRAFLDVVYNHLGPEGNYLGEFGPYFTAKHKTPWGDALDFSLAPVRRYFVENALRWVAAAGASFDGLRLDAVHGIVDDSPVHILKEIADAVRAEAVETGRTLHVIAESDLNDPALIERDRLDGSWADELHHALHVALTGETQGYYADFAPPHQDPMQALLEALHKGWHYGGIFKPGFGKVHGAPAQHLPARHFVVAAQNHDQIGNRARGERLTALTDEGGLKAAAALIALQPALPLYFQGEEWGAREPFQYFVSHGDPALVEAVRKGRHEEFKGFAWDDVPDPQAEETFLRSKLDWSRRTESALRWHKALLTLRREHPSLQDDARASVQASAQGKTLLLQRGKVLLVARLDDSREPVRLPPGRFRVLLDSGGAHLTAGLLRLEGRGAVVLEGW